MLGHIVWNFYKGKKIDDSREQKQGWKLPSHQMIIVIGISHLSYTVQ